MSVTTETVIVRASNRLHTPVNNETTPVKRKYTKGPKWNAYMKRVGKKKNATFKKSGYKYISSLGHGLHHVSNADNQKELWESTKNPTPCAMKFKNGYIEFKARCLPSIKGINA